MRANLPKSWLSLPQKEKDIISKVLQDEINKAVDHEEAEIQKVWLQMACIILHNALGRDKDECIMFLGNWKQMYRRIGKCGTNAKRDEYLKAEMQKIFGEGGYPYEWIDSLENRGKKDES